VVEVGRRRQPEDHASGVGRDTGDEAETRRSNLTGRNIFRRFANRNRRCERTGMQAISMPPTFVIVMVLPALITRGTERAMSIGTMFGPRHWDQTVFVLPKMGRKDDRRAPSSETITETCQIHYVELHLPFIAKLRKCEDVEKERSFSLSNPSTPLRQAASPIQLQTRSPVRPILLLRPPIQHNLTASKLELPSILRRHIYLKSVRPGVQDLIAALIVSS